MSAGCFDLVDKVQSPAGFASQPPSSPPVATNHPPAIFGNPSNRATVGSSWSFTPSASDPDGDPVTFIVTNKPRWMNFNELTGQLSGVPQLADVGDYSSIRISAYDGEMVADLPAFSVTVQSVSSNSAPTINGTPPSTATVGQQYLFQPGASDPDGDTLTFDIANQPGWLSFDFGTGQLIGTPVATDARVYNNVVISVSDGLQSVSLPAFSIDVRNPVIPNRPPQISGSAAPTAEVGQAYSFQPGATDPDGDDLTFFVDNQPPWTIFDPDTGQLSGTPAAGNEGTYLNILISVSDGTLSAALPGFDITVVPVGTNEAPIISGNPPTTATIDQLYTFQPNASDPDGDDLNFLIDNQPSWATFDPDTGQLTGTPVQGQENVYADIVISVTDGNLMASLSPFSITVSQAATGSVTLTWTAPTTNTDGSPLTDLKAYMIYYGTSQGNYPNEIRIDNPGLTSYVIDNLTANTYYFVSTSINSLEIESDYSNVATKTIN